MPPFHGHVARLAELVSSRALWRLSITSRHIQRRSRHHCLPHSSWLGQAARRVPSAVAEFSIVRGVLAGLREAWRVRHAIRTHRGGAADAGALPQALRYMDRPGGRFPHPCTLSSSGSLTALYTLQNELKLHSQIGIPHE